MRFLTFLMLLSTATLYAQPTGQLIVSYSFEGPGTSVDDDEMSTDIVEIPSPALRKTCGVSGRGLLLDGNNNWFLASGPKIEDTFRASDFSLSFYIKPLGGNTADQQVIISKQLDCEDENAFSVRFIRSIRLLTVQLTEGPDNDGSLSATLPNNSCWFHIVVVRKDRETILYINGEEAERRNASGNQRVNLTNGGIFKVGGNDCDDQLDFHGIIDEIKLYKRSLDRFEVAELYLAPDQIDETVDITGIKSAEIFLGDSYQVELNNTCAQLFEWTPADGVSDVNAAEPVLSPTENTTYILTMEDTFPCRATDSIRIIVTDPATFDCSSIALPSAFTPNGDGLNDDYGISNPFTSAQGELLDFEIFDRWGNIVFATQNVNGRWDGTYRGAEVNPGVFLYKVHLLCRGEDVVKSGSVTVIR